MTHVIRLDCMRKLSVIFLIVATIILSGCLEIENPVSGATFQHRAEIHFSVDASSASRVVWTTTYTNESGQSVTVEIGRGETFDYGGLPIVGGQITRHKIRAKRGNESDESTITIKPWCLYDTTTCNSNSHGCLRGVCDPVPDHCTTEPVDALCDDGNLCDGIETCNAITGACIPAEALDCDDGIACTIDTCYPEEGCENAPENAICDDGIGCTVEVCDAQHGCLSTPDSSLCNDGDPCTVDICGPEGCTNDPVVCNTENHEVCVGGECVCDPVDRYYLAEDGETCICDVGTSCAEFGAECGTLHVGCGETVECGSCDPFSTCGPDNRCSEPAVPPDPTQRAEALDGTKSVDICGASLFLVETDDAVQKVSPEAAPLEDVLDCDKLVHLSGKVMDSYGEPLSGVRIRVKDHPEYGLAVSRADGKYDILANGGELLTVRFTKRGYLPVQRKVPRAWEDFAFLEPVVLTETAPTVSAMIGAQATQMQIVDGETVSDNDGTRQARLMIPAGTQATVHREDGTDVVLEGEVNISMTEYTVGDNGPNAMPGDLPPTTSYTYAVELGIEEAEGAHVEFDRPLAYYVDNFLGFDPGTPVPVGFYDETEDAWTASRDGVVIEVADIVGGMAVLRMKADAPETPEDESAYEDEEEYQLYLEYYEIEELELVQLAQRYEPGESFWRASIRHFSICDLNFPIDIPDDAKAASNTGNGSPDDPDDFDPPGKKPEDDPCKSNGSIIECDNMILGEKIDLEGVPFSLHYQSDRVFGWEVGRTLDIPVAGDEPVTSENFNGAYVSLRVWDNLYEVPEVDDARRDTWGASGSHTLEAHETRRVQWDQRDRHGRFVNGIRLGVVTIDYSYFAYYISPAPAIGGGGGINIRRRDTDDVTIFTSFGEPTGEFVGPCDNRDPLELRYNCYGRVNYVITTRYPVKIGLWDQKRGFELGGWSLTPLHAYDPVSKTVYKGDGSRISPPEATITDIPVENNERKYTLTKDHQGRILKFREHRLVDALDLSSDPLLEIEEAYITDVAFNKQGGMFVLVRDNSGLVDIRHAVYKKGPDETELSRFAGHPDVYGSEDGSLDEARFANPIRVGVDAEGAVYVLDWGSMGSEPYEARRYAKVRKIDTDGEVVTLAGVDDPEAADPPLPSCAEKAAEQGFQGFLKDCHLGYPIDMAVADDGSVYVASMHLTDNYWNLEWRNAVYKIHPTGDLELFAGGGFLQGEIEQSVCRLNMDEDRSEFFLPGQADGVFAPGTRMGIPEGIALDDKGNVYIAEQSLRTLCSTEDIFDAGFWAVRSQGGVIRKVLSSGTTEHVAGKYVSIANFNKVSNNAKTGALALDVTIWPQSLEVDPAGNLYFMDENRKETNGNYTQYTHYLRSVNNTTPLPKGVTIPPGKIVVPSKDGSEIYVFGPSGKHSKTILASTGETVYDFDYDTHGHISVIRDAWGSETTIERDEATGQATAILSSDGLRTTLETDEYGYLSGISDPGGNAYGFTYYTEPNDYNPYRLDHEGLLATMTDPNGGEYRFEFDELGRLVKDEDPAGGVKTLTLAERIPGNNRADVTLDTLFTGSEESGTWVSKLYSRLDPSLNGGNFIREVTLPNGLVGRSIQTEDGNSTVTLADGTLIQKIMGEDPRFGPHVPYARKTVITPPGGPALTMNMSRSYDANEGLSTQTLTLDGKVWTLAYDEDDDTRTWTSPLGIVTTLTSNEHDQPATLVRPGLEDVRYSYDDKGRLTSVWQGEGFVSRGYSLGYDENGHLSSLRDAMGQTTTYNWSTAGRLVSVVRPDDHQIGYVHDANGNLTELLPQEDSSHAMAYSSVDLESSYTTPLGYETTSTYGPARQLTTQTWTGDRVEFHYDDDGRMYAISTLSGYMVMIEYSETTGQVQFLKTLDNIALDEAYSGSLHTGEAWSGVGLPFEATVHFSYDNAHRLSNLNTGSNFGPQRFSYDDDSRLVGAGPLPAQDLVLTYTDFGAVASLSTTSGAASLVENYNYNSFGEEKSRTFKDLTGNVLFSEVFEREDSVPGLHDGFLRDRLGRVRTRVESVQGEEHLWSYRYDSVGRLTEVYLDDVLTEQYAYDVNGNRTPGGDDPAEVWTYDVDDRLTQVGNSELTYNGNGSLATKSAMSFDYDAFGNLRSVTSPLFGTITYRIDGKNRRVGRSIGGNFDKGWIYQDGLNPVAEIDANGQIVAEFVYASRGHVPDLMIRDGVKYRIVSDHLGSVRLVVNVETGDIIQRIDYTTWGDVVADTSPGFQPFGFAGGLYDEHTGLVRFGARDYDPEVGRWTAKDPIRWAGGQANLYVYVGNDPVNGIDPSGEAAHIVAVAIGAGTVGAAWTIISWGTKCWQKCFNTEQSNNENSQSGEDNGGGNNECGQEDPQEEYKRNRNKTMETITCVLEKCVPSFTQTVLYSIAKEDD